MLFRPDIHQSGYVPFLKWFARWRFDQEKSGDVHIEVAVCAVQHFQIVPFTIEVIGLAVIAEGKRALDIGSLEQLRMVADFAELHDQIHELLNAVIVGQRSCPAHEIGDRDILAQSAVHLPLARGEIAVDVDLDLIGELILHILLDTPQHERLEDHVQSSQLMRIHGTVLVGIAFDVLGKPFAEFVVRVEEGGHDKMQQGPKFCDNAISKTETVTDQPTSIPCMEF